MKAYIRTVKNGTVKIGGKLYRPQANYVAYDGRLDGLRFVFGRYAAPWEPDGYERFVSLWGTEAAYRNASVPDKGPHIVNGSLPWAFWDAVTRPDFEREG